MTTQANRQGRPWQRKDGRWAGRAYPPGGGKPRMVYGADENEVLAKQADLSNTQYVAHLPPEIRTGGSDLPPRPNPYLEADRRNAPPPSAGKTTTRITVDLAAEDYELLGRYVAELTPEFHRLTIARTIRAMIRAAPGDYKVTAAITAQLRKD